MEYARVGNDIVCFSRYTNGYIYNFCKEVIDDKKMLKTRPDQDEGCGEENNVD
jgi:hypothetical protein